MKTARGGDTPTADAGGRLGRIGERLRDMVSNIVLAVAPPLTDTELNTLFTAAWPNHAETSFQPVLGRSITWVAARRADELVGFVNVATDGGVHAFLLDTTVHPSVRRQGLGRRLVAAAIEQTRATRAEWLHVDYEPHLTGFYGGCGFRSTTAGLLRLK